MSYFSIVKPKSKKILLSSLIATAACMAGFFAYSPTTFAALDGENGPIVYIENTENNVSVEPTVLDKPTEVPVIEDNKVVTTAPDGTGDIVAAENEDKITSATISAPTTEGNYDIVYATQDVDRGDPCRVTEGFESVVNECSKPSSDAVLNKVTIDEDRKPITGTEESMVLDPLTNYEGKDLPFNWVYQTSYSPDGTQVLVAQAASYREYSHRVYTSLLLVSTTDFNVDSVQIVVPVSKDKCLSGAFADDGTIYYSSCQEVPGIYYIKPNSIDEEKIVSMALNDFDYKENNVMPYLIDVSPDSKTVLFANIKRTEGYECRYNWTVLRTMLVKSAGDCDYWFANSTTNNLVDGLSREALELDFVPRFFSPDGKFIIGTVIDQGARNFLRSMNGFISSKAYTAVYSIADGNIVKLTDTVGVQEWAPLFIAQAEPTPQPVPATPVSTQATLPNTGVSVYGYVALMALLSVLAFGSILVGAKAYNK
ncbi:MAG: hypothetical protein MUF85_03460 [Patescibacteria group bacterium]|jgi:hypothetical protein|nr:hypothetical protein [Patescibacteria group bacterium]